MAVVSGKGDSTWTCAVPPDSATPIRVPVVGCAGSANVTGASSIGRLLRRMRFTLDTRCATRFGHADSSARGRVCTIRQRDRRKLHWQPVATLQKDRAWHALEEDTHYTTGTRMRGAQSCGTTELAALALDDHADVTMRTQTCRGEIGWHPWVVFATHIRNREPRRLKDIGGPAAGGAADPSSLGSGSAWASGVSIISSGAGAGKGR